MLASIFAMSSHVTNTHANINFWVTPIKYELEMDPEESITLTAWIRNNSLQERTMTTLSADFTSDGTSGTPRFIRDNSEINPDQHLASWIEISEDQLTLASWEFQEIEFTITVPEDATPGGHYGAVLFRVVNNTGGWDVKVDVDYGILILVDVSGERIVDVVIETPTVSSGSSNSSSDTSTSSQSSSSSSTSSSSWWGYSSYKRERWDQQGSQTPPSLDLARYQVYFPQEVSQPQYTTEEGAEPLESVVPPQVAQVSQEEDTDSQNLEEADETSEEYIENLAQDIINSLENTQEDTEENTDIEVAQEEDSSLQEDILSFDNQPPLAEDTTNTVSDDQNTNLWDDTEQDSSFGITFSLPVENKGNTHVKPQWKITLRNEDGEVIRAVGKEVVANSLGAIVDEKIVDYIPINDQWGNVLPFSTRVFSAEWKGFPYKTYNQFGEPQINYWTPEEYYEKSRTESGNIYVNFWEKVSKKDIQANIFADFELSYKDEEWKDVWYESTQVFPIEYTATIVENNEKVLYSLAGLAFVMSIAMIFAVSQGISAVWGLFMRK